MNRKEAMNMPFGSLKKQFLSSGCHPDSTMWAEVWPVYEAKRSDRDALKSWIAIAISLVSLIVALVT
jgi:hypothetical protein